MERNGYLIKRKFNKYLLPGIMMMAALQLGNLVDSIFVGNFLGSEYLSGMNLALPAVLFAQLPMMVLSLGGSTVAAIRMGERKMKEASSVFSACLFIVVSFNIILAVAGLFLSGPLAAAWAGNSGFAEMAETFMKVYLLEMPVMALFMVTGYFMNADGHPADTAAMHILANIINLASDLVYLKWMNMGIAGSALSTGTGYTVAGIIFMIKYILSKKRQLKFSFTFIKASGKLLPESLAAGAPFGCLILLPALRMFILNPAILRSTGDTGMTIYSVCSTSLSFVQMCVQGTISVIQSVGGVLFGEKDYFGLKIVLRRVLKISLATAACLMLIFLLFPGFISSVFGFNASGTDMGICLRFFGISLPFYALNLLFQTYYATIQRVWLSMLNAALQGAVIIIPLTLILLPSMSVSAAAAAALISEAAAVMIICAVRILLQKKGKLPGKSLAVLPDQIEDQYVDVTIEAKLKDTSALCQNLKDFCLKHGIDEYTADIAALAADEISCVICQYLAEYDKLPEEAKCIDICLSRSEDTLLLRVRDDGPPFNPLIEAEKAAEGCSDIYESLSREGEKCDFSGLQLLKAISEKIEYTRTLNMNNTVVQIKLRTNTQSE